MTDSSLASAASERLRELARRLNEHDGFAGAVSALSQGQPATLDGIWGSACALVAAELVRTAAGPLVVVCPHQDDIDTFCDDFSLFSPVSATRFPAWESDPGERILHDEIHADRLRTLKQLIRGSGEGKPAVGPDGGLPRLIATSIQSLLQPTPGRERLAASSRRLGVGQRVVG